MLTNTPWNAKGLVVQDREGNPIARVAGGAHRSWAEDIAIANLMAASPDLFNALELAVATIKRLEVVHPGGISSCTGTLDVCRKALEKGAPTP